MIGFFGWSAMADQQQDLLERANSAYRALHTDEAIRLYQTYLSQYKDRADVRVYLGAALLGTGRTSEALEQARRAIALDDRYSKSYALAGRIYADMQEWSMAEECFRKAVALNPDDGDAWYFFGRTLCAANRFDQSVEVLLRAVRVGGGRSRVYEQLGLAYDSLQQTEEAEAAYLASLKAKGNSYRAYLAYGTFLFRHARLGDSIATLQKALSLEAGDAAVRYELSRALLQNGQVGEGIAILKGVSDPHDCRVPRLLSKALRMQGDSDAAEVELRRASTCEVYPQ